MYENKVEVLPSESWLVEKNVLDDQRWNKISEALNV